MKKKVNGIVDIDKKKTDYTPLAVHELAKTNKFASAEFTDTDING